jgi:hypothetical protein
MKSAVFCLAGALGLSVLGLLSATGMRGASPAARSPSPAPMAASSQTPKPDGPPPLVIDKNAPLLLDEAAEPDKSASPSGTGTGTGADNAPCFVCHANYRSEPLAQKHAENQLGCVHCHGASFAHRNDENNTTPPETMYAAEDIDRACQQCHPSHDVPAAKVLALGLERGLGRAGPRAIVCTDCHGQHRLAQRTVQWDKKSGKLLPRKP